MKLFTPACTLTLLWGLTVASATAREIPRDEYLDYVPLQYPKLVRQTDANVRLHLFGDREDPGWRDEDPRDGIDDRRNQVFQALALRFAPYMVLNTTSVPMDFRRFMDDRSSFRLFVDTWKLGGPDSELVSSMSLDWTNLGKGPAGQPTEDDRKLLELLELFHPETPQDAYYHQSAVRPEDELFRVLFFDFPGDGPEGWRKEYVDEVSSALPQRYVSYIKTFVHPFIHEVTDHLGRTLGYELILQYWFYYPLNDGGNNHEGDWEHINVAVAPLTRVDRLLDEASLLEILRGEHAPDRPGDPLVIRRIDYYLHNKVWPIDFSSPNPYLPREEWEKQVESRPEERIGQRRIWKEIRHRVWFDDEETVLNTHPVCLIGADNKGFDALLTTPGSKNRDSHGTYPFVGMYRDIGPGGATEQLTNDFDHRRWHRETISDDRGEPVRLRRGVMVRMDRPDRIQILPDWERVAPLVRDEPAMRARWAWMLLPIRWGYPAVASPFAGVLSHTDTGNLAPVGPSYSMGWNVTKAARTFALYEPHRFSSHFPLGVQDNYHNSWGFFNLTLPTLLVLPPFDFVDRILFAPFRLVFKPSPTFFPTETVPFRFVGLEGATSVHRISEEWAALLFNADQAGEIASRLLELDPEFAEGQQLSQITHDDAMGYQATLSFFMGKRFVSENTVRHSRSDLGFSVSLPTQREPFRAVGELNFWEYSGSLRYNIREGALSPFLKVGYGLSWYRIEDVITTVAGGGEQPLEAANSPWVRKPNVLKWENMWPNTLHLGAGLEWLIYKSNSPLPRGIDLSMRLEVDYHHHALGFNQIRFSGLELNDEGTDITVWRPAFAVGVMLGF